MTSKKIRTIWKIGSKECPMCNMDKVHYAKGLCEPCYRKEYYKIKMERRK